MSNRHKAWLICLTNAAWLICLTNIKRINCLTGRVKNNNTIWRCLLWQYNFTHFSVVKLNNCNTKRAVYIHFAHFSVVLNSVLNNCVKRLQHPMSSVYSLYTLFRSDEFCVKQLQYPENYIHIFYTLICSGEFYIIEL